MGGFALNAVVVGDGDELLRRDDLGPVGVERIEFLAEQFQALEDVVLLRLREVARESGEVAGEYGRDFDEIERRDAIQRWRAFVDG